ncbi:MAG: DUF1302 domain-containing protein [Gammaproteobacteria bacterium]|nr:DUF1302 domain-containing protein [Gammaproteobacteria bacterium]
MNVFRKSVLAVGVSVALASLAIPSAHAVSINWGEIEGSFDSSFSVGASWRVEERDFDNQIGKVNNPNNGFDWSNYSAFNNIKYDKTQLFASDGSYSSNGDLANLAWSKGQAFSKVIKGLHELELNYKNYGLFVRGMYYKDFALDGPLDYTRELGGNRAIDVCRDDEANDQACSDVRLLDAYLTADYDWGDVPVSFRIGQQVVSWGESALISHGISSINAVDIGRLRTPGAELKEAFIPQGMVHFAAGLTDNLSMELFYQYQWEANVVPVGGTYFASNDYVSDGGQYNAVQLGFNANPDMDGDFLVSEMQKLSAMIASGNYTQAQLGALMLAYPTKTTLKTEVKDASDDGLYGIKFSYLFEDTEVGFYHMNYHSRRPLISGQAADFTNVAIGNDLQTLGIIGATGGTVDYDVLNNLETFSKAMIVYPEDIKLYGLSFNTSIGETAVAGEISHRVDEPVQIDDVELLFAAMPQQLANAVAVNYNRANNLTGDAALTCADAAVLATDTSSFCALDGISQFEPKDPGAIAHGFRLVDTTQAQVNFTHMVGPALGADNIVLFAEVGGIWIHKMPDDIRLNGPGTSRSGGNPDMPAIIVATHNGPETNPFPTDFAWGYRLVAKTDHNNVFDGVNASVKVIFSHDVKGITPDPIFLFTEGSKSLGASIDFNYQNRWSAAFSYNAFWGGKGTINAMEDKDFVSFNIKYSI